MVSERIRKLTAAGFGTAELAVTLALVAVLATVSAPSLLASWRASTLRAGAEELAAAVNLGRQLAITHNVPVCIAVAGADVRFEGARDGACSGVAVPGAAAVRLASGLVVRAVGTGVVFTGLGAATPAGRYVVVNPADGGTRSVVVAASGRVSVQ
jgi:Tfp pilus assembly protein FimT